MTEPLLLPSNDRFLLFPLKYPRTFDFYIQAAASIWTVGEVDMAQDKMDFLKLSEDEQDFIGMVLAFFASSDGIVNENLAARFSTEVQIPEVRQFYEFQIGIETIHKHMYGLMIDLLITDDAKKERFFNGIEKVPSVKCKAEWALNWLHSDRPFAERLIAFACVEGIFFSASFCAFFYLKKRGLMPGLTFSNELISRDEGMHADFACHVYTTFIENPLSESKIHEIVDSAVAAETQFVNEALRVDLIGLNSLTMIQYVKYVADRLLLSIHCAKKYNVDNPYDWMDLISLSGKTNFFEKRVGEYQKSGVMGSNASVSKQFTLVDDF